MQKRSYAVISLTDGTETAVLESAHFVARRLRYRRHTERLQLKKSMHLNPGVDGHRYRRQQGHLQFLALQGGGPEWSRASIRAAVGNDREH